MDKPSMVAHVCSLRTLEAQAGGGPWAQALETTLGSISNKAAQVYPVTPAAGEAEEKRPKVQG